MSGFAAIVPGAGAPVDRALLERLAASLAFRGPDGSGIWSDGVAGLAHALLRSSAEQGRARQPLGSESGLAFSGDARLDGREELIEQLRGRGVDARAEMPDSELVFSALQTWGEDALAHLQGDFTFAAWDAPRRHLFCAHDHFGVCPLYYAETGGGLVVSNTLETILLHPAVAPRLDERAIADLLLFGRNCEVASTSFTSVRRVPPGHCLVWSDGDLRVRPYWQPPTDVVWSRARPAELVEQFRLLLTRAVVDRLRSDRAGVALSGGLDSGSVTVLAHAAMRAGGAAFDLRAYTIEFREFFREEEGRYAALVAESLGIPREVLVAEDFLDRPPSREPERLPPEPGPIPERLGEVDALRRVARFGRVFLHGFGGDPLLFPSRTYWRDRLRRLAIVDAGRDVARHLRLRRRLPPLYLRSALRARWVEPPWPRAIPAAFQPDTAARVGLWERRETTFRAMGTLDPRGGMARDALWSAIFAGTDPGWTGIPVRSRFPFFDLRLYRFVLTLPPIPWLEAKTILREAMRGALPEPVRQRPKVTLGTAPARFSGERESGIAWRLDLARTPELATWIDRKWLEATIRAPGSTEAVALAERAVALAYWLRHWRPPRHDGAVAA